MAKRRRSEGKPYRRSEELTRALPPGMKLLQTLAGHQNWVRGIAFDQLGHTLASSSADRVINLWDTTSGKILRALDGHEHWVNGVAFDPSDRILSRSAKVF